MYETTQYDFKLSIYLIWGVGGGVEGGARLKHLQCLKLIIKTMCKTFHDSILVKERKVIKKD